MPAQHAHTLPGCLPDLRGCLPLQHVLCVKIKFARQSHCSTIMHTHSLYLKRGREFGCKSCCQENGVVVRLSLILSAGHLHV